MSRLPSSLPDLTASILARTSGPTCGRLRALACDLVDGALPPDDRDLAHRHLEHCPDCRSLVSRLEAASEVLLAFAQLEPGAEFTAAVLSRTRLAPPFPAPPQDRLLVGWARLMRRPRAALEAAYLATAAGLILSQVPLPGTQHPVGSALVSRVRTESRASLAGASSRVQAWTTRAKAANPIRLSHHRNSVWSARWSRLIRRIGQAWLDLSNAARKTRVRFWRQPPTSTSAPAEPSGSASRSAL
ncbi:MAG: zf-HC2 domain-containing protein [Geothrix sp.]|nr:zf-HC2 domain-containing protein [Geothrix sp.]